MALAGAAWLHILESFAPCVLERPNFPACLQHLNSVSLLLSQHLRGAGHFGKGVKVEINRLVQAGCTVRYWTGNATWAFARLTTPGCTIPELHVQVRPGQGVYDFVGIAIMAKASPKRLLQVDEFLFLQEGYSKIASNVYPDRKWSGLELLLDQQHWGKVFIHSIFVANANTYKQFGLNYTGDKSIFGHLGIGTYRNRVNEEKLVMAIPAMVQDLVDHMSNDPECRRQYMHAMVKLTELMWQPDTALKELVDPYGFSSFPDFGSHRKRLSQGLHDYLRCHPAAVPVCSCAKAWNLAADAPKAEDVQYLCFEAIEVSETMYLLFQKDGLLQSRDELWEMRKEEIFAMPDPLEASPGKLSPDQKQVLRSMREELGEVCKKYVTADQIVFREMRGRNLHVLQGFTDLFVIDTNIIFNTEEVHNLMTKLYGADRGCQQPCQCPRLLLIHSMADTLSRQKGARKDRVIHDVMTQYIRDSKFGVDLPSVLTSSGKSADSAVGSGPSSAANSCDPTAPASGSAQSDESHDTPAVFASHESSSSSDQASGCAAGDAAQPGGSSQPAVRLVRERETPVVPSQHDPVVFHNNVQAALAAVMQRSAGQTSRQGVVRSSSHPSGGGLADTVTVRLCPNGSKHTLLPSNITLRSVHGSGKQKLLHFPYGFDMTTWSESKSASAQDLYRLLEGVHELIMPHVAAVNLYYDANDGCIAFNKGNQLWYNAYADDVYNRAPQSLRMFDWYVTVCHELAHNFRSQHDEVFSDYLAHIVLQYSRDFYAMCRRFKVDM